MKTEILFSGFCHPLQENLGNNCQRQPDSLGIVPYSPCASGYAELWHLICVTSNGEIIGSLEYECTLDPVDWGAVENGVDPPSAGGPPYVPQIRHKVNRVHVQMSDGSLVEFRKEDRAINCDVETTTCNQLTVPGTYLAVNGSGLRLERHVDYGSGVFRDELHTPGGGRYVFYPKDSTNVYQQHTLVEKYVGVDGNVWKYDKENQTTTDTLGRSIQDPLLDPLAYARPAATTEHFSLDGLDGNALNYSLVWANLDTVFEKTNTQTRPPGFDQCLTELDIPISGPTLFSKATPYDIRGMAPTKVVEKQRVCSSAGQVHNPVVLSEIVMPDGRKYHFKYNEYGEITKIIYPSNGYERFEYGQVKNTGAKLEEVYAQSNRGVTKQFLSFDGVTEKPPTLYSSDLGPNGSVDAVYTTTAPDGSKVERILLHF